MRVSSILKKEKGIRNLIFDTCGEGYFEIRKGYEPDADALNELLKKNHMAKVRIAAVVETDVPVPEEIYEVSVAGLG